MLFSQRKGLKPIKSDIQIEGMDQDLRNGLWNAIWMIIYQDTSYASEDKKDLLIKMLWYSYFKETIDSISTPWTRIKNIVLEGEWNEVYDIVEFIAQNHPDNSKCNDLIGFCNHVLERELSGYRFVGNTITEITSPEEIAEIEQAINLEGDKFAPVRNHMRQALSHLADRKNPDYRNSVKESISAVEAICIIIGGEKATLGTALKRVKEKIDLHPSLEGAFDKLYGYTSNADGIRHALLAESNLDFEDAKFMLIACSGFMNYLIAKGQKAGIL